MKKCKVGVIGVGRGQSFMKYCRAADNAQLVAICDKWVEGLEKVKKQYGDEVTYYTDYETFVKHDMDVVVLANYATEHAPFAIKAMKSGKHVISEVLPCQTMAEAVALIECCEETGKIYCYAENGCYNKAVQEMKAKFQSGALGEFEYGEGEYMHNCEPIWHTITQGDPNHWRNNVHSLFYCTHSAGPLIHITGMRPVKVTGFEGPFNARRAREGARSGGLGLEIVTLENGGIFKSVHGGSKNSNFVCIYGSKGRIERPREDATPDNLDWVYANLDQKEGVFETNVQFYEPENALTAVAKTYSHGGSDFFCLYNAFNYITGDKTADVIDVYEGLDMWMCGFFGYLSVLDGGASKEIPNLRDPAVREQFRNDNRCNDPKVAGDQLLPSYSKGNPEIPAGVYDRIRLLWEEELAKQAEQNK